MKWLLIALLILPTAGCSNLPTRSASVSLIVREDSTRVTSATATMCEKSLLVGEWQTTVTLRMTPTGPQGQIVDKKTKSTIESLGTSALSFIAGYFGASK